MKAGFKRENIEVKERLQYFDHNSREGLKKFANGINVFRKGIIPEELLEEYDEFIVNELLKTEYFNVFEEKFAQWLVIMEVRARK